MAIEQVELWVTIPTDLSGRMTAERAEQMRPLIKDYIETTPTALTNHLGNYVREVISFDIGKLYHEFSSGFKGIPQNVQVSVTLDRDQESLEAYDSALGNFMERNYG